MVPNQDAFIRAYLAIKLWAKRHGIFSEAFGFLDEITLLFMVAEASCNPVIGSRNCSAEIVTEFFDYFGTKNLADFVTGDIIPRAETAGARSRFGQGIVVRSYYSPCYNVSSVKTASHACIVQNEITNSIAQMQDNDDWNWDVLFRNEQTFELSRLVLNLSPTYESVGCVKIEAAHWGASIIEKGRYFNSIDTAVAEFVRKLALKETSDLLSRPWPVRLQRGKDTNADATASYHCACYLISLHVHSSSVPRKTHFPTSQQTTLEGTLSRDIDNLQTSLSSIKPATSSSFFAVNIVPWDQLDEDFVEDYRSFGPIPVDEAELDELEDEHPVTDELQTIKPKVDRDKKTKKRETEVAASQDNIPRSRLRPALDVLNRLRFDSKYSVDDYVIGYEDRHTGIMEMPVTSWKASDSTVEDFIPQSRIVYYKRKSDGAEVWNRRTRLDVIFGSGGKGEDE